MCKDDHKLEISSFDARSRAHFRRDCSWGKVRQSEANLVTGIGSTPDGNRSPHFLRTRGRVHVVAFTAKSDCTWLTSDSILFGFEESNFRLNSKVNSYSCCLLKILIDTFQEVYEIERYGINVTIFSDSILLK